MKALFRFDATEGLKNKLASFSFREIEIVCCPENEDTAYERLLPQMDALWHVP